VLQAAGANWIGQIGEMGCESLLHLAVAGSLDTALDDCDSVGVGGALRHETGSDIAANPR